MALHEQQLETNKQMLMFRGLYVAFIRVSSALDCAGTTPGGNYGSGEVGIGMGDWYDGAGD